MKQLNLFREKIVKEFGGSLLKGKRKTRRPMDSKKPLHLILKAKNQDLLLRNVSRVEETAKKMAKRFGVNIHSIAVNADHIHLCFQVPNRDSYKKWIRAFTSILVTLISGLKWNLRPFTRIVTWGRDFKSVLRYLRGNQAEGNLIVSAHHYVERWVNFNIEQWANLNRTSTKTSLR